MTASPPSRRGAAGSRPAPLRRLALPDDSRAIDMLSAAPLLAMSDQLESHLSPGGYAFRGQAERTGDGRRAFAAGGS